MSTRDSLSAVFLRHRWRLALALVLLLTTLLAGVGLLSLSGGFLTAAALAGALGAGSTFNFFSPSAGIRGLTVARIVSRYFEKLVGHDVTLRVARDLRVWFFRRALPLAPSRLGNHRTGDLLARLVSDIGEVDGWWVRAWGPLLALAGLALVAVVAAACIYWPAAVLLLVIVLMVGVGVPWLTLQRAAAAERQRAQRRAALRTLAYEGLEGAADLTALEARDDWSARVQRMAVAVASSDRRRRRRLVAGNLVHGVCAGLGTVAMLAVSLHAFAHGQLAAPMVAALVFLCVAVLEVSAGVGLAWQARNAGEVAAGRLQAVTEQAPAVIDSAVTEAAPLAGALCLDNVVFAWPGQPRRQLDGVTLSVPPGHRIAIRGDSGAGKTTLSSLLLRLWDPQQGRVCFGGVDLRDIAQEQWHQRVAWLPQGAPVFSGTLAENLRVGDPQADDHALWAVLSQVRLDAWAQQQGGLEAWLGENGATVSGGQARRLALARALLRQAPILLLDEPTDGLDVDTAHALLHDLSAALGTRTLVMITHDRLPAGVVDTQYRLRGGQLERLEDVA